MRHRIAFVIPTRNRPELLLRMLRSLEAQSVPVDQCIVVDGSDSPIEGVLAEIPALRPEYIRVYPPSLSAQRNAGMRRLRPDITLAGYLDDDLVFVPGALHAMMQFWGKAPPSVGGARFKLLEAAPPRGLLLWLMKLFLLSSEVPGRVLRSGFVTALDHSPSDLEAQWLSGGATIWRREVVDRYVYDEWFIGTGFLEDVDFSYRVSRSYRLVVVADAKLHHLSPPVRPGLNGLRGRWEVINRLYFVRKHESLSELSCWWALLGQFLIHIASFVRQRRREQLDLAIGNLSGLRAVLAGRLEQHYGILR